MIIYPTVIFLLLSKISSHFLSFSLALAFKVALSLLDQRTISNSNVLLTLTRKANRASNYPAQIFYRCVILYFKVQYGSLLTSLTDKFTEWRYGPSRGPKKNDKNRLGSSLSFGCKQGALWTM